MGAKAFQAICALVDKLRNILLSGRSAWCSASAFEVPPQWLRRMLMVPQNGPDQPKPEKADRV